MFVTKKFGYPGEKNISFVLVSGDEEGNRVLWAAQELLLLTTSSRESTESE